MTRSEHPAGTHVALYGSCGLEWRARCKELLDRAAIPWHDPTDERWDPIDESNGDRLQPLIDQLVSEEHAELLHSKCVIFHLAGGADPPPSLAARCELGLLAGTGLRTFVVVDAAARGRNYVWAMVKLYDHLTTCASLEEAVDRAIEFAAL